jgi:ubiquinone/menaquinone biosynthesis C-methylase UbiE
MDRHDHSHHANHFDWDAMAAFAELDAEVLMPLLDEVTSALYDVARSDTLDIRRILDVGSGPGVAACRLAEQFGDATIVAADGSSEMLAGVTARAERLGLSDRVETRLVELPDGIDDLGSADSMWVSMVLHHVGDESAALRAFRRLLRPGGLLALVEFGDPLRVLPDDGGELGNPEVWQRLDRASASWIADLRAGVSGAVASDDYPSMLAVAGFEVVVDRTVSMHLGPPLDHRGRELAVTYLKRMRDHVEPYADASDLAVLDRLVDEADPGGIWRRPDALLDISRHVFVARAV